MKGTHIFARGTSCAPSRNMYVPLKKVLLKMKGTHIFARGTSCAPSRNMYVPLKKYFLK